VSDDLDLPDGGHRSVPPVVASLAVDPSTAATIAETFRSPRSAGRTRSWLGPIVALLIVGALIVATVLLWDQAGGFVTPDLGTPAPSF
jgi:hypothetical protein